MVLAVILAIALFLVFGDKCNRLDEQHIMQVYETRTGKDTSRTHFALYGFAYWMGFIAFLCLLAIMERIRAASLGQNLFYNLIAIAMLVVVFAICVKVTKMYYAVANAREAALQKYLAEE